MSEEGRKTAYFCDTCGGSNIDFEVTAYQDENGIQIGDVMDKGHYCRDCDGECRVTLAEIHQDTCPQCGLAEPDESVLARVDDDVTQAFECLGCGCKWHHVWSPSARVIVQNGSALE